jgi:hypothetical protein
MRIGSFKGVFVGLTAGAAAAALAISAAGQQVQPGYKPPRTPGGKVDFNGIWQVVNTANYDLQTHVARPALALRPGPQGPVPAKEVLYLGAVGAVPGGMGVVEGDQIPYKPEMLKRKQENQEKWLERDPEIKCYLPGVPRATYMPYPFQIFQSDQQLFFAYEYAGAVRNIFLKDPGPAPIDSWMGQSVASWEGDTLVVTVTGLNDQSWFDRAGNFHSEAMKVTERYTRTGADHIWYEATIEDPNVFTRAWKIRMPLYRRVEPDAQLMDFKCVEFVEELMYGEWRKEPLPR